MRSTFGSARVAIVSAVFGLNAASANEPCGADCVGDALSIPDAVSEGTLFRWWSAPDITGGPDFDEPIVTDRPDFTEASVTVGRNVLQFESGYTFIENDDDGVRVRTHSLGELLFRYGAFADWFELRFGVLPVVESTRDGFGSGTESGVEDLYFGAKLALTPQAGILPEMAIVPQVTVPAGSNHFTADETLPGVNLLYGWDVNDVLSTGGSTQVNRSVDAGGDYTEWAQSWTVGYALTERVGSYAEWFAFFPQNADEAQTEHYFNGGFTVLLTDDVQWDLRGGVGLNDAAGDLFCGTGLSMRFR